VKASAWVIGTFDTKADELNYLAKCLRNQGIDTVTADVSTSGRGDSSAQVSAREVAGHHPLGVQAVFTGERASAVNAMAQALTVFLVRRGDVAGVLGAGGSGAAALVAPAMQSLPVGLPKLLVTTLAGEDMRHYVGGADIAMLYPVVDVSGLNRISRQVLANAAHAMAGMVRAWQPFPVDVRPSIGLTMFGVTTPCVQGVTQVLQSDFDCLVFHATGRGGRSFEKLAADGHLAAMIDLTTTEIADLLCGGVLSAGDERLDAPIGRSIPWIGSCGALDMVNFWARETVPERFSDRRFHVHNANVTLMRTSPEENCRIGSWIANKLNKMRGPVRLLIPERGVSSLDAPGQPFWWPDADAALFDALAEHTQQTDQRRIVRVPAHINDERFVARVVETVRELVAAA